MSKNILTTWENHCNVLSDEKQVKDCSVWSYLSLFGLLQQSNPDAVAKTTNTYFPHCGIWEAQDWDRGTPVWWGPLSLEGCPLPDPPPVWRMRALSEVSCIRALISFPGLHPHDLIPSKRPSPNAIALKINYQHVNFGGHKHISILQKKLYTEYKIL